MMWYVDNGEFKSTDNSTLIKFEEMAQRLQLWKQEAPFNADDGIDYVGVFNLQSFLKPQIEAITDEYQQYFESIIVEENATIKSELLFSISVVKKDGAIFEKELTI